MMRLFFKRSKKKMYEIVVKYVELERYLLIMNVVNLG